MLVKDPSRTAMLIPSMSSYRLPKLVRKYINYMFIVKLLLTMISIISSVSISFLLCATAEYYNVYIPLMGVAAGFLGSQLILLSTLIMSDVKFWIREYEKL